MAQQTAVEWFLKEIQFRLINDMYVDYVELAKEAKLIEKQQIIDAYNKSFELKNYPYETADVYYNETYNK